jgi:RNA polymerase sigma factor (sigma-70 family)
MFASSTAPVKPPVDRIGDLIRRAATGDRAAFEELYPLMLPSACAVARGILADPGLVDDAVSEAAERVWKGAGTFRPGNGRAWYLTVVRNVACSMARSRGRSDIVPPEQVADAADGQRRPLDEDGVHVAAVEADFLARIRRAPWFLRLRRRDQCVVVLRYLGFTNAEIIQLLPDVTHNEVIRRAMIRAARSMRQDDPDGLAGF